MTKHRCHLYVCDVCYKKLEGYDELQKKLDEAQTLARHNLEWANSLQKEINELQRKLSEHEQR